MISSRLERKALMYSDQELRAIGLEILRYYWLLPDGSHGVTHWGRVLETGKILARKTGANIRIVQLFALFHDSCRENEGRDPEHGARGAALARKVNGRLCSISSDELPFLQDACTRHTYGLTEADVTVQIC